MSGDREAVWKAGFGKIPPPPPRVRATPAGEAERTDEAAPPARPLTVVPATPDESSEPTPEQSAAPLPVPAEQRTTVDPPAVPGQGSPASGHPSQVGPAPTGDPAPSPAVPAVAAPDLAPGTLVAGESDGPGAPHAHAMPAQQATPQPASALPLPRPSAPASTVSGRRVTASEVRSARAAARHAAAVVQGLAGGGVAVEALEAELAADRLHLVLDAGGDAEAVLNNADLIADALTVDDVECSTDGRKVHVWAVVGTAAGPRQVAAWVPLAVRDAVRAKRDETGETVTAVVLSAFNRQAGPDGSGLSRLFPEAAAAAPGPMTIAARKLRPGGNASVQLWLYLHPSQEATLDHAVARTGAGSRSALITRILEEDLGLEPTGR